MQRASIAATQQRAGAVFATNISLLWNWLLRLLAVTHPIKRVPVSSTSGSHIPTYAAPAPYSPTDFCDAVHMRAYNDALRSKPANFAKNLILLDIPTRATYHQKSLVVIEPERARCGRFRSMRTPAHLTVTASPRAKGCWISRSTATPSVLKVLAGLPRA